MSQHADMTVHQRRKPRDMFILWLFPGAAQVQQKRIPQYRCVCHQTQHTQLIFPPLAVTFSDLTTLTVVDGSCLGMTAFAPVQFC
ncbi:Uncharacterised protein [Yersinia intermedia]|jgi:hypothetical protein|nr:Uncharacterised protein [Yersinia intermedia]CNH17304.1 Uncharacterised protein [Yersinia intermedia]